MTPDDIGAALLARYLTNECTPAEAAAVRRWIAEDPERERDLGRLRAAFQAPPPAHEPPDVDTMWERVRQQAAYMPRRSDPRATALRARRVSFATSRWPVSLSVLTAAAVVVVAVLIDRALVPRSNSHGAVRQVATSTGQRATLELADGSRIILGVRSRLTMPEHFGDGPREVTLDGEAYFDVVHDAAHPFRVHAANGVAEDIGTRFVVRAYASEPNFRVVVAEGRVSAARGGGIPIALGAGQLASFDAQGTALVRRVDTASYLAWTDGRLVFDGTPLAEALAELGRWYDLDIHLADPAYAGRHVSASFTGLAEDDVLSAVAVVAGLRYTRQGRTVTYSRARGNP